MLREVGRERDLLFETILIVGGSLGALGILRNRGRNSSHSLGEQAPQEAPKPEPITSPQRDNLDPIVGKKFGEYVVEEFLGSGGMAKVFLAKDGKGNSAAVKLIRDEIAGESDFQSRFKREIKVCAKLEHPNIVKLLNWGDAGDHLYLVLEYVDGVALTSQLQNGALPPEAVVDLALPLIDGLLEAHSLGIVHRDLKPDNIMISKNGEVKIMDFGLARSEDAEKITKTGDSLGTPAYLPPEQITGAEPTPAADQYSLGVILYEAISGKKPFRAKNPLKMLMQHLSESPEDPAIHISSLKPEYSSIILRMLEKNPEARFSDLAVVRNLLQKTVDGLGWDMPEAPQLAKREQKVSISSPTLAMADQDDDEDTIGFQVENLGSGEPQP